MSTRNSPYKRSKFVGGASVLAAGALLSLTGAAPVSAVAAAAADGDVDVVNTETVQIYMNADGEVESRRVYEQLVLAGEGTVDLRNPVSGDGLRNLDGFGGFDVKDGAQVVQKDVDGVERSRTVSDYDGDLPLDISISYQLDGESVEPGDVVGQDGRLEVEFTVENVTAQEQEVTIPDGKGGTMTAKAEVPIPIVGSLTTTAPSNFTNVRSGAANLAGDGKGGTQLSFTMTLFPPIGSAKATFGYTADIEDGVVPRVQISALPVNPLESPSFKTAAGSYQGGADTGTELAAGAMEIDANLLKLRDGAGELLAGLIQLRNGSAELQSGLAGEAAPGARRLAEGAGELRSGAGELADGTGSAATGSAKLRDGLGKLSDGLDKLAGTQGLPKAARGAKDLKAGVDQILAGFGKPGQADTLIDGLTRLETGLGQLSGGLSQLRGDGTAGNPGLVAAKGGVDQVQGGLEEAVKDGGSLDQLMAGLGLLKTLDCGPTCQSVIENQILPGVRDSKTKLSQANQGLLQVSGGLQQALAGLDSQLIPGAKAAAAGAGDAKAGAVKLKAGVGEVRKGIASLEVGLTSAVAGILQLDDGATSAYTGSKDLASGLTQIDDGAGRLSDGSTQLSDGAGELADGLLDAADGSGRLKDGLTEAAGGAPELVDGAGRLSEEGTKVIAKKGEQTAQSYGQLYAVLEAGAQRADQERMAFGAPEGATGLMAYQYVIKGADGEGSRNWVRGITGVGFLAAGLGALAWRRRLA